MWLFGFFVQSMLPEFPVLPSDSLREGVFLLFFAHPFASPTLPTKKAGAPVRNTRLKNIFKKTAATYSPTLHCSTIGASGLNCSVRNGKRWDTAAITAINLSADKSS